MAIPEGYSRQNNGAGYYKDSDGSGPYSISSAGAPTLIGSGGGGGGGGGTSDTTEATQLLVKAAVESINTKTASAGRAAAAASKPVALSTEDKSALDAMSAKLPAALGSTTAANSLSIAPASDAVFGGAIANPTATFTRPADTTAYAVGDLVANNTTAGSVSAMSLTVARVAAGSCMIRRLGVRKSSTSTTSASFRVHLFRAAPSTVTNGDNGAFSVSGLADYIGAFDVTCDRAFTDGASGMGLPVTGSDMSIKLASGTAVFALIEARAAYTPASAEVFTIVADVLQN